MSLCGSAFTVWTRVRETLFPVRSVRRHGTAPNEVVHFDYLYMGESGPQGSQGLSEDGGFRYILVIMDDLSNIVLMEPVEVCTAEATAASLLHGVRLRGCRVCG